MNPSIWYIVIGVIIGFGTAIIYFVEISNSNLMTQAGDPKFNKLSSDDVYPKAINPNPQKHVYTLIAQDAEIEVSKGVKAKVWTYNGTIPGPTLRFNEGDDVTVHFINKTPYSHTIHFHGTHDSQNDGVFPQIMPGEEYTYSFKAEEAGFFMYHCHAFPTTEHVRMGMFGGMIIDPVHHPMAAAREYLFTLSEFDSDNPLAPITQFYPINGYANQYMDYPIRVVKDEIARFYVMGIGGVLQSPFHVHSTIMKVWPSGILWNEPYYAQTHLLGNGDTTIIEATWKQPGRYFVHVHGIQEERGSMAILDVLEDGSKLKTIETPSNMKGSVSMIEWQEDIIKDIEKPKIVEYENLNSTSISSVHMSNAEQTDKVSIVKDSWNPKIIESYSPPVIKVKEGTTVTWANGDTVVHTVTEAENKFDSGYIQAGSQWSHAFDSTGEYHYLCTLHPWMKGTILVE